MNYAELQRQDRRLVLLRGLESSAQYRANSYLLQRFADQVGHVVSADVIAADLAWLAEAGLLAVDARPDITVATLTPRGADVATGRATHPGVARPSPGA